MNILEQAESDLSFVLEDSKTGFGVDIVLKDNVGGVFPVVGQTNDIGFFIDPQSGVGVAGRNVNVTVRISTLTGLGGGIPTKKWIVEYTGKDGNTYKSRVQQVKPDRHLGVYNMILESLGE